MPNTVECPIAKASDATVAARNWLAQMRDGLITDDHLRRIAEHLARQHRRRGSDPSWAAMYDRVVEILTN